MKFEILKPPVAARSRQILLHANMDSVLLGALVRLMTVLWADMLGREGRPGPAETFLRNRLRVGIGQP